MTIFIVVHLHESCKNLANSCCLVGHVPKALFVGQEADQANMVAAQYEHVCFACQCL